MLTLLMKKTKAALAKKKPVKVLVNALMGVSRFCRRKLGWKGFGRRTLGFLNKKVLGGKVDGLMIGGSPCDEDTMRFFLDMGIDVSLAYGLTELGAPLAVTGQGYYPGTTGRVLRHTEEMDIRVVNPDEQGRGEGEILSPYRMLRYLRESDMEGCFTDDGYFRSGDLGYFDKNDCLVICGRAKEAIVLRNGEKLLPEEIEKRYEDIQYVANLSVFRVPGEGGCDSFCIAVEPEKGTGVPDDLPRSYVLERAAALPAMYQPQEVYILRELPLSSSHKVQRFRLTEMVQQGLTAPVSEATQRNVDEDDVVSELRDILIRVGGPQWKTAELTEGTPLGLDSLQTIDLFVSVQDHFGMDLFQLAVSPESFGELLDAVNHFDEADKNNKPDIDLAQYPQPVKDGEKVFYGSLVKLAKLIWNVHGSGMENIPKEGNFLICSNHVTVLDPGWICSCLPPQIKRNTAIVGKSDLLDEKALKDFVRSQNFIPVDRTGNSMATLDRCRDLLEEGWNILIFPEGTNYENKKEMFKFKEGPARLSIATGRPIVPVHIKGLLPVDMERKAFLPPAKGRIDVVFGAPVSPEGKDVAELNEALRHAIEGL